MAPSNDPDDRYTAVTPTMAVATLASGLQLANLHYVTITRKTISYDHPWYGNVILIS